MKPLVSVVVLASSHPESNFRAVQTILNQTLKEIEIIIVCNTPGKPMNDLPQSFNDPRVTLKNIPETASRGEARNVGIQSARGNWIAFLDAPDEWAPEKLEIQFQEAEKSVYKFPVISCRLTGRREGADFIWPRRFPKQGEDLSDYLFCRSSPFYGEGLIKPSTLFAGRQLFEQVPFRESLRQHEDYDWLLRIKSVKGMGVQFVYTGRPLVIWYLEKGIDQPDLQETLDWVKQNRSLFTPRALAAFLLAFSNPSLTGQENRKSFWLLLKEAFRMGKPSLPDIVFYFMSGLIPQRIKKRGAARFEMNAKNSSEEIKKMEPV